MINKEVFINTIKISCSAIIAIMIAYWMGLDFAVSAGIVAILSIQPTKQETIKTALGRLAAFAAALGIAAVCFYTVGFHLRGFGIYLVFFILLCQIFGWHSAMAMNSVLISHFLTFGNMGAMALRNEILIFVIGVGTGVFVNMHLHKNVDYIEALKKNADDQIKKILFRMSERILDNDMSDYNGACFTELEDMLRKAKNMAELNFKNQLSNDDIYDKEYIKMRDRQCRALFEMYKNVRNMQTTPLTAKKIADFMKVMSEEYHQSNTAEALLVRFAELDSSMKSQPLPTQRIEFEDRAKLYALLRYIEEFLEIKAEFAEKYLK